VASKTAASGKEAPTGPITFVPPEQSKLDPSFLEFRKQLEEVVKRRDVRGYQALMFGDLGTDSTVHDTSESGWQYIKDMLRLGFLQDDDHTIRGPYVGRVAWSRGPEPGMGREGYVLAIRRNVAIHSKPSESSRVMEYVSYQVLQLVDSLIPDELLRPGPSQWSRVRTFARHEGFVLNADIYPACDDETVFEKQDGKWKAVLTSSPCDSDGAENDCLPPKLPIRYAPRDNSASNPGLREFIRQLSAVIAGTDLKRLEPLAENWMEFVNYENAHDEDALWREMRQMLSLGVITGGDGRTETWGEDACAPSVTCKIPDKLANTCGSSAVYIAGTRIAVRAAPRRTAAVVGTASLEFVRGLADNPDRFGFEDWMKVQIASGVKGYVPRKYVRMQQGPLLYLSKINGQWKIRHFSWQSEP
jgi:hypothetical protein